jgi:hypothetical protein
MGLVHSLFPGQDTPRIFYVMISNSESIILGIYLKQTTPYFLQFSTRDPMKILVGYPQSPKPDPWGIAVGSW